MRGYETGCITGVEPNVLRVCVINRGDQPAGPFSVAAGGCVAGIPEWQVDGLAPGASVCLEATEQPSWWTPCQVFVDSYNQVAEPDEEDNTWSGVVPLPTQPALCTVTATPTATFTATPSVTPTSAAADLRIAGVGISLRGYDGVCITEITDLVMRACIVNDGGTDAGPFSILAGGCVTPQEQWRVAGLAAGETVCVESASAAGWAQSCDILADAFNEVPERDESNNRWSGLLPVPTLPPWCTPTATATPTPTATATPSATPTTTATPARLYLPLLLRD